MKPSPRPVPASVPQPNLEALSGEPAPASRNLPGRPPLSLPRRGFLRSTILGLTGLTLGRPGDIARAADGEAVPVRLRLQTRKRAPQADGTWRILEERVAWPPAETAAIVCDMWDLHHCKNATDRVGELAPRMNDVLGQLRRRGVLIIHAPSSCLGPYENTAARQRARQAPRAADLPQDIGDWCHRIPAEEKGTYPIDQSDGGCDTPDEPQQAWAEWLKAQGRNPAAPWQRQIDSLEIRDEDAVSDSGVEIWNLLALRRINHVLLMGVHTNMCVLGRPFGLRQMARNGKNVLLVRDLTDTMYNPKMWPQVDHFTGTDLIVEHIEKYVCPTTTSASIVGGIPFRFRHDPRPVTS